MTGNGTAAPTGPAGWTRQTLSTNATGNFALTTWTYVVPVTTSASYIWTASSKSGWAGGITQYSGVDRSCPVGSTSVANGNTKTSGGNSTFSLPTISTLVPNAMVDAAYAVAGKNKTFNAPGGWTARVSSKNNTNGAPSAASSDRLFPLAGTTGAATATVRKVTATPFVADLIELDPVETKGVTLAPVTLSFAAVQGSSPAGLTFTIKNSHLRAGCAAQTYTAAVGSFGAGWTAANLPTPNVSAVTLATGATSGAITISISSNALPSGTYTAVLTITDAAGNTATIAITLSIACTIQREANVATATAAAATSLLLTEPAGWSSGDALVATLVASTTAAPATPAGWTLVGSNTTGSLGMWMYRATKAGSATTTWTGFTSGKLAGAMAAYQNVNNGSVLDAPPSPFTPAVTVSGNANLDVNACTTVRANAEVVAAYAINMASAGSVLTVGPGLTSIASAATGAGVGDVALRLGSDRLIAAAGSAVTDTGTVAPSQAAAKLGALCTLAPANVPPAVAVSRLPVAPTQGETVTWTIVVTNPAVNSALTNLMVSDTLPAGVTFVSLTADAAGAGLTLSANAGAGAVEGVSGTFSTPLAPGNSVTFTLVGTLGCGAVAAQSSTVVAQTGGTCGTAAGVPDAFTPGVLAAPGVTATRDLSAPTQGDTVTYSIVVTNNNVTAPLNALTMSDTLPAGLVFSSLSVDGPGAGLTLSANAGAGAVEGAVGALATPLPAGASVTFTLVATVACGAAAAQNNRAYAELPGGCLKTLSTADSFTPGTVGSAPIVTMSRSPASPSVGDTVTYLIAVTNPAGNAPLNGLVLGDSLPAGMDFVSLEGGSDGGGDGLSLSANAGTGQVEGAFGQFTAGTPLASGAVFSLTLTGTVSCAGSGAQASRAYAELPGACQKAVSALDSFPLGGTQLAPASVVPACGLAAGGFTMTITGVFGSGICTPVMVSIGTQTATIQGVPTVTAILAAVPTFTGTAVGTAQDVTVSTAAGSAALASAYLPVAGPGALAGAGSVTPKASVGQWFTVRLTLTNTGSSDVTGIIPALAIGPGGTLVTVETAPAGGLTLAAGSTTTLSWTCSADGAGLVSITVSATGATCPAATILAFATVSAMLQTAASLDAAASVLATTACTGRDFLVTLTVTNTGQATATGVMPAVFAQAGTGGGALVASAPAVPVTLIGGASVVLTWTFTGSVVGGLDFTTTVTGLDANSARPTATGPVSTASVTVNPGALLQTSVVAPARVTVGQWFTVALSVTNAGSAAAAPVTPGLATGPGGTLVIPEGGPVPTDLASLGAGTTTAFIWTYSATGAGTVALTGTATGTDVCGTVLGFAGGSVLIQTAPALAAALAVIPSPGNTGRSFLVTLTMTNTGQADAAVSAVPTPRADGTATISYSAGPTPALPTAVPGGGAITFTWTFTASTPGSVTFSTTATAADANSGAALPSPFAASAACVIAPPAVLAASASLSPPGPGVGDWVTVALTVTNTGGGPATGVLPVALDGSSPAAGFQAGPVPGGLVTIAPGAATTFVWTWSVNGVGSLLFGLTVTGTDQWTGAALFATRTIGGAAVPAVGRLAIVSVSAAPTAVGLGETITVVATVSNTGTTVLAAVTPGTVAVFGTGRVGSLTGPTPASVASLGSASSASFTWTFKALQGNDVSFAVGASAASGATAVPVATGAVAIREAGTTLDSLIVYPNPFAPAAAPDGLVRFRFMPPLSTVRIHTIAGELVRELTAGPEGLAVWDGRNGAGSPVQPGVYIYMAKAPAGGRAVGQVRVER